MDHSNLSYFWHSVSGQRPDRFIRIIVLMTIFTVAPVGYHIIVLNVPSIKIQNAIKNELLTYGVVINRGTMHILWSFIVACQSIGAFASCFFVIPITKRYGTKNSLIYLNNVILFCASLTFFMAPLHINVVLLLVVGRLLIGVYTGIGCALVPIYIHELAPKSLKGSLSCFLHISVCIGSALGAFLSLEHILGGPNTWNYLLALPMLFGIAQMIYGLTIPAPPSYFLSLNNQHGAADSVRYHYSLENIEDDDALLQYHSIVAELSQQISLKEALEKPEILRGIWLGCVVSTAQVFSGSMATVSYSTSMLDAVSFHASWTPWFPTLGALLSVVLTLPALRLVETCGRKQLFINTLAVCSISSLLISAFSLLSNLLGESAGVWPVLVISFAFLIFGVGYNVGVGPVGYFLPSELVGAEASGAAMGCAVAVNWLSTMLTTLIYYPLNEIVGGWSYFLFIIPTTFFTWYLNKNLLLQQNGTANVYNYSRDHSDDSFSAVEWIKTMCGFSGANVSSSRFENVQINQNKMKGGENDNYQTFNGVTI